MANISLHMKAVPKHEPILIRTENRKIWLKLVENLIKNLEIEKKLEPLIGAIPK